MALLLAIVAAACSGSDDEAAPGTDTADTITSAAAPDPEEDAPDAEEDVVSSTTVPVGARPAVSAPFTGDVDVSIDLTSTTIERSRYGVLHWNAIEGTPVELVDPLHPTVVRTPFVAEELDAQLERFETVNVLFSDSYGYPPGWSTAPYVDATEWAALVRTILEDPAIAAVMAESPERLIFEPWNEPDIPLFWDGTLDQYTDLWIATEAIVREVYPDALVGGPSYALYSRDKITAFLDRCIEAGCRVDYLIWHGFQLSVPEVRAGIAESNDVIADETYAALGLRGLLMNEYPLVTLDILPAENLGFLEAFEAGDVFGSARACWGGTHRLADAVAGGTWTNCGAGRLNGFVTPPPNQEPRAVWWVYERFAAGLEGRVEASASDPDHVTAVGSVDGDAASVLVGHLDDVELEDPEASRPPIDVAVSIDGIDGSCAEVTIRAIPDSRDDPLLELPVLEQAVFLIENGTHHLLLEDVPAHEVRVVEVVAIEC